MQNVKNKGIKLHHTESENYTNSELNSIKIQRGLAWLATKIDFFSFKFKIIRKSQQSDYHKIQFNKQPTDDIRSTRMLI